MDENENTKHITLRIKESLIDIIDSYPDVESRTSFITNSIVKEIDNRTQSPIDLKGLNKKVARIDTKRIEQMLGDLAVKQQIIFKEINKQNEVIKLIHRRSTFASSFAMHTLDELKKSSEFSDEEKSNLIEIIETEINEIGI